MVVMVAEAVVMVVELVAADTTTAVVTEPEVAQLILGKLALAPVVHYRDSHNKGIIHLLNWQ